MVGGGLAYHNVPWYPDCLALYSARPRSAKPVAVVGSDYSCYVCQVHGGIAVLLSCNTSYNMSWIPTGIILPFFEIRDGKGLLFDGHA